MEFLNEKKEYLNYLTEQDVIDRYSKKRNIPKDEIEDLYFAFKKWILFKLNDTSNSIKAGMIFPKFCTFYHKFLDAEDLKLSVNSPKYKRAEEQLARYLSVAATGIKIK